MLAVPSLNELCRCMASVTGSVRAARAAPTPAAGAGSGMQPASSGTPSPPTSPARSTARRLTPESVRTVRRSQTRRGTGRGCPDGSRIVQAG
jgi:hypothetical protein